MFFGWGISASRFVFFNFFFFYGRKFSVEDFLRFFTFCSKTRINSFPYSVACSISVSAEQRKKRRDFLSTKKFTVYERRRRWSSKNLIWNTYKQLKTKYWGSSKMKQVSLGERLSREIVNLNMIHIIIRVVPLKKL